MKPLVFLFTDFGAEGPYLGQMEAVLRVLSPTTPVINLLSNAPRTQPQPSGLLLAALVSQLPPQAIVLAIVDPGVGGSRKPLVLEADGRWYLGPDNGILNGVAAEAHQVTWKEILWRPERLSNSFHGRDLYAPVAARLAEGDFAWPHRALAAPEVSAWVSELPEVIYVDHYGNLITGLRYRAERAGSVLSVGGIAVQQALTFCAVPEGQLFWYENSMGLIEVAANCRSAADLLPGSGVGAPIGILQAVSEQSAPMEGDRSPVS